jgi:outer membrane protein
MSFKGRKYCLIVILLFFVAVVYSQEKIELNLDESVSMALANNPEIKIAEKEVAKAHAAVWEAYSALLPSINGSANFQHAWSIQETVMPNFLKIMLQDAVPMFREAPDYISISFGMKNTLTYGVNLTQPLFLGGAGVAGVQIASAAGRAAQENYQATRQKLIYNTVQAFYGSLLAQELVKVQEKALEQAQANLDQVKKKFEAGSASGFDKMRAQVEVANIMPEVITARNNYQLALTNLRTVLGLDKNKNMDVQGSFEYTADEFGKTELADLQKLAMTKRPEIQGLAEQKYISKKGITIARSSFMPKLLFMTDYSKLAMKNDEKFSRHDFSEGFTSAVSLQIPLFTGFKNAKSYQKARLDYKVMIDTEKQVQDGVNAQVEVAFNTFQEANQKHLSAKESVQLAEEALRLATLMYDEGASTQLDVLNSQLALNRARLNYVSSLFEYQMARYELRKSTGTLEGVL